MTAAFAPADMGRAWLEVERAMPSRSADHGTTLSLDTLMSDEAITA